MSKILIIDSCYKCYNFDSGLKYCEKSETIITDCHDIPADCPLEEHHQTQPSVLVIGAGTASMDITASIREAFSRIQADDVPVMVQRISDLREHFEKEYLSIPSSKLLLTELSSYSHEEQHDNNTCECGASIKGNKETLCKRCQKKRWRR